MNKTNLRNSRLTPILFVAFFLIHDSKIIENLFNDYDVIIRRIKETTNSEIESLLGIFGFAPERFQRFHDSYADGNLSLEKNIISSERIEKYHAEDVLYPAEYGEKDEARQDGERVIREGRLAVIMVKGGIHTRFLGGGVDKGIMPLILVDGEWKSFVEIHLQNIERTAADFKSKGIIAILSNSYLTYDTTGEYIRANNNFGLGENLWNVYQIGLDKRLIPTPEDLETDFERRQARMRPWEREVALGQLKAEKEMVTKWVEEAKGDRYPYEYHPLGIDRKIVFYPTGHINVISSLFLDGTLKKLIQEGVEYIMSIDASNLFNIYELGVDIDPLLIGILNKSGKTMLSEVTDRGTDEGGLLARVDGRLRLIEGMALAPVSSLEKELDLLSSFTHYIKIEGLVKAFGFRDRDDFLNSPDTLIIQKVKAALENIPYYTVLRRISEILPDGRVWNIPVIGFEQPLGDLPLLLSKEDWLIIYVPRGNYKEGKFLPIKTLEDLVKVNNR